MPTLDLSDNTLLVVAGTSVEIQDPRDVHRCNDCRLLFRLVKEAKRAPRFEGILCRLHAGRRMADGSLVEVAQVSMDFPHAVYGRKVLQGTALYADGFQEEWRIRVDPLSMRFEWVRQPDDPEARLVFRVVVPSQNETLELWHTGRGRQIAHGGAEPCADKTPHLESADETELLFHAVFPRNCFRIEQPQGGDARILHTAWARDPLPGEPEAGHDAAGQVREPVWEVVWEGRAGAMVFLNGSWGAVAAARDFVGRRACVFSDATLDFGPFYAQMYLGCLPLNILEGTEVEALARSSVLTREPDDAPASPREVAWAAEFLYLVDPKTTQALIRGRMNAALRADAVKERAWPASHMNDDAVAGLLIMAGRCFSLDHDEIRARAYLDPLRRCAEYLLSLRTEEDPLPVTARTWDAQGVLIGKEPYFTALCYAALYRLAFIEESIGFFSHASRWRREAQAIQQAALRPYQYGGLWHPDRNLFINHLDYKDPADAGPRRRNWQSGRRVQTGTPWADFALYENVVPFWLGLVEDEELIEAAYDWIDSHYTYASGRGGPVYPPYLCDTSMALLDVCVRLRYNIPGAETLLQTILEHALDSGVFE
ncbi:MAG TPA: hypothetical protein PKL84_10330, partial [Candidatus Hydrogenedentes bacterium]|nr:hypothetical protein [Candidatus Hydrogenedentota bacterium]